ncbi:MAG: outer membrane protein, partial [Chthoniobacter sp.]|nr:outer membrane protein [Chthoniobacter sp.]
MRALLGFFLILWPLAGRAGPDAGPGKTLHLTLESAIRLALEKNYLIQVQTFAPQISHENIARELGIFDPAFNASYERDESTNRLALPQDRITQSDAVSTGIDGLTPWGMRYRLGLDASNARGTRNGFANSFNVTPAFSLSQPLLRGFGPAETLYGVRLARSDEKISVWALRAQVINVVSRIAGAYNELFYSRENRRVSEQAESLAQQLLGDNQRRTEIGTMSPLDVTTARAEVAKRHKTVILAAATARDNEMLLAQLVTDRLENLLNTLVEIEAPPTPVLQVDSLAGC